METINLKFLQQRRAALKLTLQDMAEALDFKHAANYMKYERGDYEFKANHIPILAKKLNCSIEELYSKESFFKKQFAESAKGENETSATKETA